MPVEKFKSYEDAREALWCFEPDAVYFRRLKEFWGMVADLQPIRKYPHGVFKYKSVAEAGNEMDKWLLLTTKKEKNKKLFGQDEQDKSGMLMAKAGIDVVHS